MLFETRCSTPAKVVCVCVLSTSLNWSVLSSLMNTLSSPQCGWERRDSSGEFAQSLRAPLRVGATFSPSSAHSILLDHIIAKEPASNFPEPFEILSESGVKARTFVPVEFEMRFLRTVKIKCRGTECKEGLVIVMRPGGILGKKFLTFHHMVTNNMKASCKIVSLSFEFQSLGYSVGNLRLAGCFGGSYVSAHMSNHINTAVMGLKVKCTNVQGGPPNPYLLSVSYLTLKCPVRTCQFCWDVSYCIHHYTTSFLSDNCFYVQE